MHEFSASMLSVGMRGLQCNVLYLMFISTLGSKRCGGKMRFSCKGIFKQKSGPRDGLSRICWPCPKWIRGCHESRKEMLVDTRNHTSVIHLQLLFLFQKFKQSTLMISVSRSLLHGLYQWQSYNSLHILLFPHSHTNHWPRLSKVLSSEAFRSLCLCMSLRR